MLAATTCAHEEHATAVLGPEDLMAAQRLIRRVPVGESVVEGILTLVRSGRPETSDVPEVRSHVAWGPGPRASQALILAAKARAVMDGRLSPSLDDVLALAMPVLKHRMALNFGARAEGVTLDDVIRRLTAPLA
jgi:MoxR-like ATPase